jgi:hypothetical protein
MCQTSNLKDGVNQCLHPWQMQPQDEIGNWKLVTRNFVREIIKIPRRSSFNRGLSAITNGFENRLSQLEFVNCLLSGSARKVDLISEILDGRETESEMIFKTSQSIDKDVESSL